MNFIDVGQGDGCHIVTPEDEVILIDAGGKDNKWDIHELRFNENLGEFAYVLAAEKH